MSVLKRFHRRGQAGRSVLQRARDAAEWIMANQSEERPANTLIPQAALDHDVEQQEVRDALGYLIFRQKQVERQQQAEQEEEQKDIDYFRQFKDPVELPLGPFTLDPDEWVEKQRSKYGGDE